MKFRDLIFEALSRKESEKNGRDFPPREGKIARDRRTETSLGTLFRRELSRKKTLGRYPEAIDLSS